MNVSKTPAEMGWAKISCCRTEFLDVRRQGFSNKANQGPVDGCVSPPSAPASHAKPSLAPKIVTYSGQQSPVLPALCREANGCILPQMNKCILSILIYKYSHARVYVGRTVLESRRCFFLLTYFKYLCSMHFDSSCSWFWNGLDLAFSETILKPLRNMNSI